jgi:hypothetical protein
MPVLREVGAASDVTANIDGYGFLHPQGRRKNVAVRQLNQEVTLAMAQPCRMLCDDTGAAHTTVRPIEGDAV